MWPRILGSSHPVMQRVAHALESGSRRRVVQPVPGFRWVGTKIVELVVPANSLDVLPVFGAPAAQRRGRIAPRARVVLEGDAVVHRLVAAICELADVPALQRLGHVRAAP